MRRLILTLLILVVTGTAAYTIAAVTRLKVCETSTPAAEKGRIAGNFDPAMSGVCRFACATKLEYEDADVVAQPGAISGKLTQCPVSGVVFVADGKRPSVDISGTKYVACCGNCAAKLQASPAHYLKA